MEQFPDIEQALAKWAELAIPAATGIETIGQTSAFVDEGAALTVTVRRTGGGIEGTMLDRAVLRVEFRAPSEQTVVDGAGAFRQMLGAVPRTQQYLIHPVELLGVDEQTAPTYIPDFNSNLIQYVSVYELLVSAL